MIDLPVLSMASARVVNILALIGCAHKKAGLLIVTHAKASV